MTTLHGPITTGGTLRSYLPGLTVSVGKLAWVLGSAYGLDRAENVWKALRIFQPGTADFVNRLIKRSAAAGCERTLRVDRGAVKGCGMTLVG